MKDNELEFNINGNLLEVLDYSWCINSINALYITDSCMDKGKYAIQIATTSEIDELYFRTVDEILIKHEFMKLCNALNQIEPSFKTYFPRCFNFANVKDVQFEKQFLYNDVKLNFNSGSHISFKAKNKTLKNLIEDTKDKQLQDFKL